MNDIFVSDLAGIADQSLCNLMDKMPSKCLIKTPFGEQKSFLRTMIETTIVKVSRQVPVGCHFATSSRGPAARVAAHGGLIRERTSKRIPSRENQVRPN